MSGNIAERPQINIETMIFSGKTMLKPRQLDSKFDRRWRDRFLSTNYIFLYWIIQICSIFAFIVFHELMTFDIIMTDNFALS